MSLPALPVSADTRSITERVNVLIRDYNTMLRVPAGCVMPFAGATPPNGWLLCYGQAVSRTGYSDLFAAIGTTYGAGDGSTTFNLPDLRGRVAAGKDDMGGSAAGRMTNGGSGIGGATLGAAGGAETHTLTAGQMPSHTHANAAGLGILMYGNTGVGVATVAAGADIPIYTAGLTSVGSGSAHNNTQPTIVLNHIIST
jgi:microcystin-dependent protein